MPQEGHRGTLERRVSALATPTLFHHLPLLTMLVGTDGGRYNYNKAEGTYSCSCCGAPLFSYAPHLAREPSPSAEVVLTVRVLPLLLQIQNQVRQW